MRGLLQFTLDLFDAPDASTASIAPDAPPAQPPRRTGPDLPALPLADSIAPARFVHPRATREARIGDARVAYELTRGKRRTIGFVVGAEGLSVRAPRWVALRDVDAAVQEKADWIVRKLVETQQRHAQHEASRIEWRDGASFPFLGETVVVQLDPRHGFDGVGAVLDERYADIRYGLALLILDTDALAADGLAVTEETPGYPHVHGRIQTDGAAVIAVLPIERADGAFVLPDLSVYADRSRR